MKKIHHFKGFSIQESGIHIKLNMNRMEKNFQEAQYKLDSMVMTSMVQFMPMDDGNFIQRTTMESAVLAGTGKVVAAAAPFGRYLYEGKVMVDSATGAGPRKIPIGPGEYILRFRKGAKLKATDRPLKYSKAEHPKAQARWFEPAKAKDKEKWVKAVKNTAGGG